MEGTTADTFKTLPGEWYIHLVRRLERWNSLEKAIEGGLSIVKKNVADLPAQSYYPPEVFYFFLQYQERFLVFLEEEKYM